MRNLQEFPARVLSQPDYRENNFIMPYVGPWKKQQISIKTALLEGRNIPLELPSFRLKALWGSTTHKSVVTLLDQAVVSGTNFLTGVIVGRTLIKEDFGLYMLGLSIVLFGMSFQTSLIMAPYTVYSPRLQGLEHRSYTGSTLIHQFFISLIALVILVLGGGLASLGIGPQGFATMVWVLAAVMTFILLKDFLRQICFAQLRLNAALLLDSAAAVIQLGSLLFLAHEGLLTLDHVFWIFGLAGGIPGMAYLYWHRRDFHLTISQASIALKKNWSFAKWSFGSAVASLILSQLYPWILAGFHDMATVGVLAACWSLVYITNPFLMGMTNLLSPMAAHAFAQGGVKKMNRLIFLFTIVLLIFMATFCLIALFKGDWLLSLFYGKKYVGNGQIVAIAFIRLPSSNMTIPLCCGLMAAELPDIVFKSYILGVVLTFIFGIPLVKYYGINGIVIGMIISAITVSLSRLWGYISFMAEM